MTKLGTRKTGVFTFILLVGISVSGFLGIASRSNAANQPSAQQAAQPTKILTADEEWLKFINEPEYKKLKDATQASVLAAMTIIGGMGIEPSTYKAKLSAKILELGIHITNIIDTFIANKDTLDVLLKKLDTYKLYKQELLLKGQLFGLKPTTISSTTEFLTFLNNIKGLLSQSFQMLAELFGKQMQADAQKSGAQSATPKK